MARPSPTVELSWCAEQVRTHDPERWLGTLFAPAAAREALFALYAFDHEIARVRHVAREPMAGMIRLQWWREALEAAEAGAPPAHPVAAGLGAAWPYLARARAQLDRAIDARERELEDEPLPDLGELEAHVAATSSGIVLAALEILRMDDEPSREAGHSVGLTWGLASLLRALPWEGRARRVLLPAALLERHGIASVGLVEEGPSAGLSGAVGELAERGLAHLNRARQLRRQLSRAALPALLPGSLAGDYLLGLQRSGHDVFAAAAPERAPRAPLRLLWRHLRGVF